jgi:hypothetical protein
MRVSSLMVRTFPLSFLLGLVLMRMCAGKTVTWKEWSGLLQASFEKNYYVPAS